MTLRALTASTCLALLSACGSLDNEPFKTGTLRGQMTGHDGSALVAVIGRDDLVTTPDADGRWQLVGVPLGRQDLLIIVAARQAQRVSVEVSGASTVDVGVAQPKPTVNFELYVRAPGGQRVAGTVSLLGTPLTQTIRGIENEVHFYVPAGCYQARAVVVGLGEKVTEQCLAEGAVVIERTVTMDVPDGSAGREGCVVAGCAGALSCEPDLSCR
jgi:hypothetical protein